MKLILVQLRKIAPYLTNDAKRFLWYFSIASAVLSVLDVIALMLLAAVLAGGVSGGQISIPLVGAVPADTLPLMILALSGVVLLKSAMSVGLQWQATRHFAQFEVTLGDHLFRAYIHAPWTDRLTISTARIVQMADGGIANVVAGFLLPLTTLPGLLVTAVGVVAVLFVQQPVTALITLVYLGSIALVQYAVLGRRTREAARVARDSSLRVAGLVHGMMNSLKEIALRDKADEVSEVVHLNRFRTARARANSSFLATVPRFIFDSAIIGGFLITGGVAYAMGGMEEAISAVALFGIAGFRLVPSLTGFQAVISRTVTASPYVDTAVADIASSQAYVDVKENLGHQELPAELDTLSLVDVSFTYPRSTEPAVRDVSIEIPIGSTVGIVGSSGAGKSTLVDILLGLLVPSSGSIQIDGNPLGDVLASWRERVGYVPQEVTLFDGTIAQNVALTWGSTIDLEKVERALHRAQLWDVVVTREGGLDARVGERGLTLSGGQRQRLGIARALYSDPLVLVLDEATSALDTKTEADVASAIQELAGEVTVISVAHRLSTIRHADRVVYMKDGRIQSTGSFDEVVATNDEFAQQAALAGLT